jgi:hypothetical protein
LDRANGGDRINQPMNRARILSSLICILLGGCGEREGLLQSLDVETVQMAVFVVNAHTFELEGGILIPTEPCGDKDRFSFPLSSASVPEEAECGKMAFFHSEFGDTLFSGSSCWMGMGNMTHPRDLLPSTAFPVGETRHELPETIELWTAGGIRRYPTEVSYDVERAWKSIERLSVLEDFAQGIRHVGFYSYIPDLPFGEGPRKWIIMMYSRRTRLP